MRGSEKLTVLRIKKLSEPGLYGDGRGLWLQVSPSGSRSWLFRYMLRGKARAMGLGPVHAVSLAEARDKAREARALLVKKIDPLAQRASEIVSETFETCATRYIDTHESTWKNEKHRDQWRSTLVRYAYPVIGRMAVDQIEKAHILKILEPIWQEKHETALRLRGRIEVVLDWAKARRYRDGDNPAMWKGNLGKLLPSIKRRKRVEHHPAVHYRDLPAFMAELRQNRFVSARALEFTILTAARTSETIGRRGRKSILKARHGPFQPRE